MKQKIPKNISPIALNQWLEQNSEKPLLVDVREMQELHLATFPFSVLHIPLSKAAEMAEKFLRELDANQPVVVFCHSGIRSWNFAMWMIEQDSECEIWNLEGGIDAWSVEIDPSVPRY